ncbi:glycosyl transferase [Sporosarcina newyorkensis 2681]|uniref:Glycosyl transferase n=1 Tax=Sporosarcina newyorkensis 2681 TaxID=1027292 RepID=F9DQ74_9BACL|nr:glycosyltransferase family 2 protein [Sporosarcina newyorkensis]EGQ27032.1 glycosyl transferase [Sporosarcina newyorkensis 2681]
MTQGGPKITVITACYNSERTIEQTIQSVLDQTYGNIEYIIVDGDSTDGTMNIVEKYRDRIDVVVSEKDRGVYDAFNKGIELATGDYINFMNADDYFSSDTIVNEIAGYLKDHRDIMMLHGDVKAFDEVSGHWHFRGGELSLVDFEKGNMCPHQSVFTHKQLFKQFGGFDLKYEILADVDFTIKCFTQCEQKVVYLPIQVANFRLGGLSNALQHEKKMHTENSIIHFDHFGSIPNYSKKVMNNYCEYYINQKYRSWLEILLTGKMKFDQLSNEEVAIFGTKKNATLLYHALKNSSIDVSLFLDNDEKVQGNELHGKKIISPSEAEGITAILISIERDQAAEIVKMQLKDQFKYMKIYTWHELI